MSVLTFALLYCTASVPGLMTIDANKPEEVETFITKLSKRDLTLENLPPCMQEALTNIQKRAWFLIVELNVWLFAGTIW